MAFGRRGTKRRLDAEENPTEVEHEDHNETIVINEDDMETEPTQPQTTTNHRNPLPLYSEITKIGKKKWTCNHCKRSFTSSYTRVHHHFFGPQPGEKSEIIRCSVLLANRSEFQRIRAMVEQAESSGGSQSLTKSTIKNSNVGKSGTQKNPIAESFRTVERQQLDVLIVRALCANGIPFNVLRNPDFTNMIKALSNAPSDYKPPSFDRARTSVLDEVYRQVDNELAVVKETWGPYGTSIVSDGWTNVKGEPLINVIASNNRGSMFMYADDFSGQEKTGKNIADYLLKSIDEIGPSNVLQVVTDNAANCKAAGKRD